MKNALRKVAIKTNSLWPFSILSRMPYYIAIRCFVHECSKFSAVKSVYLRHSLAEGNWIPGLSDIDLTVIIDRGLNAEKEFLFLVSFWKSYERLKKFFSMLGQVEILDDEQIKTWTKFGIRGYESKCWKLLYGAATKENNYAADPERLAIDSLNHAIGLYRVLFLRDFFNQRQASLELQRLALKILRYIDYGSNNHCRLKRSLNLYNLEELFCQIIMGFERRVASLYMSPLRSSDTPSTAGGTHVPANPSDRQIGQADRERLSSCQSAIEAILFVSGMRLSSCQSAIEAILFVSGAMSKPFVVLKDRLDASATRACVSSVLKASGGQRRPIILSYSVFDYMLRVQDSLKYCGLVKGVRVAYGRDLISEMQPPDEYSFIKNAVNQSVGIFTYSRSKRVILPSDEDNSIKDGLRIALSTKLSLEKREFVRGWDELLKEYEKFYPRDYERIVKAKENGSSWERFMLLKDLADDVQRILEMNPDSKYWNRPQ